jgi:hypothetical protein
MTDTKSYQSFEIGDGYVAGRCCGSIHQPGIARGEVCWTSLEAQTGEGGCKKTWQGSVRH